MNSVVNVTGLHRGTVEEDIKAFLSEFESQRTQKNYESSIRTFFLWYRNKDLKDLSREDILLRNADVLKFRQFLLDHPADYSNVTINNVIAAIQSLYKFLEKNEYRVKAAVTKIRNLADDSKRSGFFHTFEIEQIPSILLPTKKGIEKVALVKMAYTTSFRKNSLLNLTWDDITPSESPDVYRVSTIGKGLKKHAVDIPKELYEELLLIKDLDYYQKYTDNKIFHLSTKTIQCMMDYIIEKLNIEVSRNIVFHSFRNYASMFGTLEEKRRHYNHSNINITDKYYGRDAKNRSSDIGLRIAENIQDSIFDGLTKEELIAIIIKQSEEAIFQMKRDAKKLIEEKVEEI